MTSRDLRSDVQRIADELPQLTDSLENIYQLMSHVWNNREELYEALADGSRPPEAPEPIRCYEDCGATIDGLRKALREGWIDIGIDELDDDGFLGWCPSCIAAHEERERKLNEPKSAPVLGTAEHFIGNYEAGETIAGWHVVGNFKKKKDAQAAANGAEVRGYLNGKFKRGWVVLRPADSFPVEDAVAMGLTGADIDQAKAEGVTTMLGLRRIEKNNRGTPKTLF